jgi:FdhD protein
MQVESVCQKKIIKVSSIGTQEVQDALAIEEPLEIRLEYFSQSKIEQQVVSVTMRTPGNDEELAIGFLFTEGIINSIFQIAETTVFSAENKVLVKLKDDAVPFLPKSERNFYTTSSCGVCGKTSVEAIRTISIYPSGSDRITLKPEVFYQLAAVLQEQQQVFQLTGGLHASALFDLYPNVELIREDIGRHNALDKAIGACFLKQQLPVNNKILLLSGRASFELIQKATMAGIRIVAAIGAPSSLAVKLAEQCGITLIGFLRDRTFNIYSCEARISYLN